MSEQEAAPAPAPASKKPLIIVGVLALVLGGGGGFAGAAFMGGGSGEGTEGAEAEGGHGEAPAEGGHGEAPAEGGHAPAAGNTAVRVGPDGMTTIALGAPFTINLRGSGGGRVLRMDIQIEAKGEDAVALETRVAAIRDTIMVATSDYSWSELEGTEGKTRLRDELLARVNGVTEPLDVNRLYFTQFVVQ